MKINWPLVLVLLWFSVLVGIIVDQYQFAALMALTTIVVTFCVFITWVWDRLHRPKGWRIWASTDDSMVGLTPDDMYPLEVAEVFKSHFSQPNPGVLVMGRNTDGSWQVYPHDEVDEDPDI
jgi:hypothetical protein